MGNIVGRGQIRVDGEVSVVGSTTPDLLVTPPLQVTGALYAPRTKLYYFPYHPRALSSPIATF